MIKAPPARHVPLTQDLAEGEGGQSQTGMREGGWIASRKAGKRQRSRETSERLGAPRGTCKGVGPQGSPKVRPWVIQDGKGLQGAVLFQPPLASSSPSRPRGPEWHQERGLFGAVDWKTDFNPLCSCEGARSALLDQGSWHSGGPLPRPGLESPQSCRAWRSHCPSGLRRPART